MCNIKTRFLFFHKGNQYNDKGEQIDTKSGQWFGATVSSAGIDGPLVVSKFNRFNSKLNVYWQPQNLILLIRCNEHHVYRITNPVFKHNETKCKQTHKKDLLPPFFSSSILHVECRVLSWCGLTQ